MNKSFDLRQKKVIDIESAEKIGYIRDIDIDFSTGKINSVYIPRRGIFSFFSKEKSVIIPWNRIMAIGSEYILVKKEDNL